MLTIQDLVARYDISRQQIYERMKAVGVNPIKRGNRSLFDEAMVATLDEQHLRLKEGFPLRDTVSPTTIDVTPLQTTYIKQTAPESSQVEAFKALGTVIADALQTVEFHPTQDTELTIHRQLQEIADQKWTVTTRMLARILGQSNSSLHSWGSTTKRLGFSIERTGERGMFRVLRS